MGDKGGKKNKDKSKKQNTAKHTHQKKDHLTTGTVEVKGGLLGSRLAS